MNIRLDSGLIPAPPGAVQAAHPSNAAIEHLWDTHVGEPTPERPLTSADKVAFARAVLYSVAVASKTKDPAVAAIEYSLTQSEGDAFLRCWMEGDWEAIRKEWPGAPEDVFVTSAQ